MARSANTNARGARSRPRTQRVAFAALRDVKRAITVENDIASDVAFQNDVNALLAALARLPPEPAPEALPGAAARDQIMATPGKRARAVARR
jgi:hypothetical protein